jgi:ankyrin repeat protein
MQKKIPISLGNMQKCDIWSYGLLVWEILADGEWYFKYSWRHDPTYARTSNTSSNDVDLHPVGYLQSIDISEGKFSVEPEDSHVFGSFDVQHLRSLAKDFVNKTCSAASQFEKSFLRPMFDRTLRINPDDRPSNLARLPIMRYWNQSGTASLQSKLAMQLKSSELSFDMFRLESAPEILWTDQRGMLEDMQRIANWEQGGVRSSVAAYQTSLCYMFGFGTAIDLPEARFYLRRAAETSHPLALLFNEEILPALGEARVGFRRKYASLLTQALQQTPKISSDRIENVKLVCKASSTIVLETHYSPPLSHPEFLLMLPGLLRTHERPDIPSLCLCVNGTQSVFTLLEAAVLSGDADLVCRLADRLPSAVLDLPGMECEPALIQACRAGRPDIVCKLLKKGADPCVRSVENCTILHWLFCMEDDLSHIKEVLLPSRGLLKNIVDLPCVKVYTIHQQWPLRLHGTPLAFATMACSEAAVEMLLELGADPMAKAFNYDTEEVFNDWTPLHLAIKYHLPSLCRAMLKRSKAQLTKASWLDHLKTAFTCALAFSSTVERFCIHSDGHAKALEETISCLPRTWLFMRSANGHTPLMQAIDFDDLATVRSLLESSPKLAITPLLDPQNRMHYTYPILFACQLSGRRDHPSTLNMFRLIASFDNAALARVDSQGRTCLHMAAAGASEVPVEWLLARGRSSKLQDLEGRSALFAANSLSVFLKLLDGDTSLWVRDRDGASLGHYAVLSDRYDILREMIKKGAPLDLKRQKLGTPLHCAVLNRSTQYVSMLLEAGSDPNTADNGGYTPFRLAIESEAPEIVQVLLEHGARINPRILLGHLSKLQSLFESQNAALLRTLIIHVRDLMDGEQRGALLHYFAWKGDYSSLMFSRKIKQDIEEYRQGSNLISSAVRQGYYTESNLLPFSATSGQTPIHTAARFLNSDIIKVYCEDHAMDVIGVRDAAGKSPLDLALEASTIPLDRHHSAASDVYAILLRGADQSQELMSQIGRAKVGSKPRIKKILPHLQRSFDWINYNNRQVLR